MQWCEATVVLGALLEYYSRYALLFFYSRLLLFLATPLSFSSCLFLRGWGLDFGYGGGTKMGLCRSEVKRQGIGARWVSAKGLSSIEDFNQGVMGI